MYTRTWVNKMQDINRQKLCSSPETSNQQYSPSFDVELHCLLTTMAASNFFQQSIYTPLSTQRLGKFSCSGLPPSLRSCRSFVNSTKIFAEKGDNLDHLQRVSNQQPERKRITPVAPTGLWDTFPTARTMQQMMDTMVRMMEGPYTSSSTWPSVSQSMGDGYGRGRTPWAIKEREMDYKMRFDMPGMTKNDVNVWIEENMLIVKAEVVPKTTEENQVNKDENISDEEWPKSYGRYSWRIALPENIEFEKIKAEVKDGVLYITVPKAVTKSDVIDIDVR